MISRNWLKHGFWNTLEQGFTRVLDALSTLVLVWALEPEVFSRLALAQAWVAPLLFFFICPEIVMYRDFGQWKARGGPTVISHVRALRSFGWLKILAAFFVSFIFSVISHQGPQTLYALVWAFILVLAPQAMAPDREFLRLDLRLKELNGHTLFQKTTLLGGTIVASFVSHGNLAAFGWAALLALLLSGGMVAWRVEQIFRNDYLAEDFVQARKVRARKIVLDSIRGFSLWSHLNGTIWLWMHSMDLFFLGVFGVPARLIGLYASALKLGNLVQAGPLAVYNIFSVWLGRRTQLKQEEPETEKRRRFTLALALLNLIQVTALWVLSPWILRLLSRGRWTGAELVEMRVWLIWIAAGFAIFSTGLPHLAWVVGRMNLQKVFWRVYVPWLIICVGCFAAGAFYWGAAGASWMRVPIGIAYLGMISVFVAKGPGTARTPDVPTEASSR